MIHPDHWHPSDIRVTQLAFIRTQNLLRILAGRSDAIMTADAGTSNAGMIEIDRAPAIG